MKGNIPSSKSKFFSSDFRLEFLGDALLDFLVVRHTFLNYEDDVTPGCIPYSFLPYEIIPNSFRSSNRYSTRFIE